MSTERVKWKCPGCGNLYLVRTDVGLSLCPECKRKRSPLPQRSVPGTPLPQPTIDAQDDDPVLEITEVYEDSNVPLNPFTDLTKKRDSESHDTENLERPLEPFLELAAVADSAPQPTRNRNLNRYSILLVTTAKAVMAVALMFAGIALLAGYGGIIYVVTTPDELQKWQEVPTGVRILIPFVPFVGASLAILAGWVVHLTLMTLVEFSRAIVEIEQATKD